MGYEPIAFTEMVTITARRLRHIETQYERGLENISVDVMKISSHPFRVEVRADDPAPGTGRIYYNSGDNSVRVDHGDGYKKQE